MPEATRSLCLHPADVGRVDEASRFLQANDTGGLLTRLLPRLGGLERDAIETAFSLRHAAVLVFPPALGELLDDLRARGFEVRDTTSSVVVQERLSRRYRRPAHSLDVSILKVDTPSGHELELFALPVPPGSDLEAIATGERDHQDETHLALGVAAEDRLAVHALRSMLADAGWMRPDGGGYNRRENATVLYFRDPEAADPLERRIELAIAGRHPELLDAHRRRSRQPAEQLLELMTGAWRTKAIAVAAELHLADRLAEVPGATSEQLAQATGAHADSLARLLRYLATLGLVAAAGDGYALTEVGRMLCADAEPPLRPLALIYGGPFYESFGHMAYSVRTGRAAFDDLFGSHHFEYFAARPELAKLFDQAMASSASMFGGVAELIDFSLADTVVDVAGGNGELLTRILRAAPGVRGVLLEREHVVDAARATLAAAGCADRCELVIGDFTAGVPAGGDIYVLSRVLHDWDDDRCREILFRCAEAMPEHAMLLIVERLLPEDHQPSLAVAWDVHMLCNVGGRERTAAHFAALLADAGLEVTAHHELPLEVAVLAAAKIS